MDAKQEAIAILESFRQRKPMYIQPVTVEMAVCFLRGFYIACTACGLVSQGPELSEATKARGWDVGVACPTPTMLASGLDAEATIDELISIYQEALSRASNT
jgi:hypothetical protein